MNTQILIVDKVHESLNEILKKEGISFDYCPDLTREEVEARIASYDGLVIRSKLQVDQKFLDKATRLRFIARTGAGMDNIDENYAEKRGITLLNAPEGNRQSVAEHMVGMLLALTNNLHSAHQEILQKQWNREKNRGIEIHNKTIALIGYGNNGQAMAKCLAGFGVNVIAYDKYKTGFSDSFAKEVSMEEVVRQADILSFHIPLTRETRNLVDQEYLFHFRKPIILLNGARGEILQIPALLKNLNSGKIIAAALDVLPNEKFPSLAEEPWFEELTNHPNVLLSPHIAGWTVESYSKLSQVLAKKIISYIRESRLT